MVIDYTAIASITAEATDIAPITTEDVAYAVEPSAERVHQTLKSCAWELYS